MKHLDIKLSLMVLLAFLLMSWVTVNVNEYYVPTTIDDFFMPGSQPLESGTFISPNTCDNCHGGYDLNAEPAFTWRGSMMAHSMRDPLFEASLVIANQDALFSGDLCIRCHSPVGWLEGRSTPTDGSALTANDREGVQCHFCHRMIDPMSTDVGDLAYMATINEVPTVNGNGMFVVDNQDIRRGPFDNVTSNHANKYDPFYTTSEYCATCHDVSNPAFSKQPNGTYLPNTLGMPATNFDTYEMFPVERTYSEWKMSAYNSPTGIPSAAFGGNKANVISCQDCHMQDVTGKGSNKNWSPIRTNMPQHDLTGGNTFVPELVKALYPSEVDASAIDAGILRARYMLQNAATMNLNAMPSMTGFDVNVEIVNETGHKLPSGYPEGRRMWINLEAYDSNDNLIYESGAYDELTGDLDLNGTKVYEAKLGMSPEVVAVANAYGTGTYQAGESFHFALNNMVVKDNRIPPRGFTNANFASVQAAPVGYSYADGAYSDMTTYSVPANTHKVEAKLYYQTVSKEYIDFLKDTNVTDNTGLDLYNLWVAHGRSQPELMVEQEFYMSTLSLNEMENLNGVKIYPNPASEMLYVKFDTVDYTAPAINLYSLNGQLITNVVTRFISADNTAAINISSLASGTYILKIHHGNHVLSKLVVVK